MPEKTLAKSTAPLQTVERHIVDDAKRLVALAPFQDWWKKQALKAAGLIVVNNSFEFREVETNKSDSYLTFEVDDAAKIVFPPVVASGVRMNLDFRYQPSTFKGPAISTRTLRSAVAEQKKQLGELLFVLIGEIDDTVVVSEPVGHAAFSVMEWDPNQAQVAVVNADRIQVGRVDDEDAVWRVVEASYEGPGQAIPNGLREAVGVALDKLQERALAKLLIPKAKDRLGARPGITDQIVVALEQQLAEYESALTQLRAAPGATAAQNDVLRLAYNFASDASGYLKLIVSVCDLKPIVLWGTLSYHVALSEAFRDLPWTRSRNKPSMTHYIDTVSDARNSAFHNLFPFRKSLNVQLSQGALTDAELTIFSEYGRRNSNALYYRDKPLVDVLTAFTRARERRLTPRFWQQNREVMASAIELFKATSSFVKELHAAR